jgi:hypothetical protein
MTFKYVINCIHVLWSLVKKGVDDRLRFSYWSFKSLNKYINRNDSKNLGFAGGKLDQP